MDGNTIVKYTHTNFHDTSPVCFLRSLLTQHWTTPYRKPDYVDPMVKVEKSIDLREVMKQMNEKVEFNDRWSETGESPSLAEVPAALPAAVPAAVPAEAPAEVLPEVNLPNMQGLNAESAIRENMSTRRRIPRNNPPPQTCPSCLHVFPNQRSLREHLIVVHIDLQIVSCDMCNRKFRGRRILGVHKEEAHYRYMRNTKRVLRKILRRALQIIEDGDM